LPEQNCNKILAKALKVKYNASIHGKEPCLWQTNECLEIATTELQQYRHRQASRQRFNLFVLE
jgi:hypothetical protein